MNIFFKSYRNYLIFFLLIACESCFNCGIAQNNQRYLDPWLQEINLPVQYNEIPNETFFRDHLEILFIGKNNGLTIIDGTQVNHLSMPGPVYVTGNDSDTLFYAAPNDLGFLIRDEYSTFRQVSRVHLLPIPQRTFYPDNITRTGDSVFIHSNSGTYLFSGNVATFMSDQSLPFSMQGVDKMKYNQIVRMIEEEAGIPEDGIRQIFNWNNAELWILGDYSLHMVDLPSPLRILETDSYFCGRILNSAVINGTILLGTNRGLFRMDRDIHDDSRWTVSDLLPEETSSIHLFSSINNQWFAAGTEGIFQLNKTHATKIDEGYFTGVKALRKGRLIASGRNGTVRYDQDEKGWHKTPIDPELQNGRSFVEYKNELFFLCDDDVYRINKRIESASAIQHHTDEILLKLVQVNQELLLMGSEQVFRFDDNEESFQVLHGTPPEQPDDKLKSFPVLQSLGEVISTSITDSVLYLTGRDKLSLLDLRLLDEHPGETPLRIEQTVLARDSICFLLHGLELQRSPRPLFRVRLLPGRGGWSDWRTAREHTIYEPGFGKYILETEAMDLYGRVTDPVQYSFSIPPPLYATWYAFILYAMLFLTGVFLFRKWWMLGYQRAESRISERMEVKIQNLAAEKKISDEMVADILPEKTANQIRNKGKAKWDKYERATVLFSDIQGFTKIAEEMNPETLIDELDRFFFHFDSVVEKYNIEKIKTIGDAYMAAGGIPHKNSTNPVEVVLAALEMQAYMQQLKVTKADIWDLRIGIHTGPVIAGVVGHKKISYDIWGDTVNTASRMESSGIPGKVNISGITYGMVKDYFLCEYRGKLPVKYKGNIDMYFVNGLRPELAVDLKGIPNKRFFTKLQLLRLGDMEEKVFETILTDLPDTLHFHRLEYARKVFNQSFLLCRGEEIEQEDRLLVSTAALMLYTGLTQTYHNFENRSAVIAREILPDFEYSENQIDQICNLILATKMPFDPNNHREKILIDARMEYIGRPDYSEQIKLLYQEMKEAGSKINGQQFKKKQLELLFDFQFNTVTASRLREVPGNDQMSTLEQERWI